MTGSLTAMMPWVSCPGFQNVRCGSARLTTFNRNLPGRFPNEAASLLAELVKSELPIRSSGKSLHIQGETTTGVRPNVGMCSLVCGIAYRRKKLGPRPGSGSRNTTSIFVLSVFGLIEAVRIFQKRSTFQSPTAAGEGGLGSFCPLAAVEALRGGVVNGEIHLLHIGQAGFKFVIEPPRDAVP